METDPSEQESQPDEPVEEGADAPPEVGDDDGEGGGESAGLDEAPTGP
jgi:hypothetical protein